jgi:hypothetical protein
MLKGISNDVFPYLETVSRGGGGGNGDDEMIGQVTRVFCREAIAASYGGHSGKCKGVCWRTAAASAGDGDPRNSLGVRSVGDCLPDAPQTL